ncbi:hypothetical protein C0995_005301 [Termitomyces sp. Mi166|nr:hypothetical protein C0995_005301 [Termitomyces sp. Mi166\
MAQALFDEHPLDRYLRSAGEARDLTPGSTAELECELDPWWGTDLEDGEEDSLEWRPPLIIKVIEIISAVISALDLPSLCNHSSPFVERFKYDVISSTLLAVSLPSAHARTPQSSLPSLPGQLSHSRTSSVSTTHQKTPTSLPAVSHDFLYLILSTALVAFAIFFYAGYNLLALATLGITVCIINPNETSKPDMSPSIESLNELIASNHEWEQVVQAALNIVDNDEQSALYGAATPLLPYSSLRIALHMSLLTTQTQCDNIRQLLSALTLPSELSQLSEMYAPPSPITSSFSHDGSTRPMSPPSRRRTLSMPTDPFLSKEVKRQTWSGTYSRLGQLSSPTFKARVQRRYDLSSVRQPSGPPLTTTSAPVTPPPSSIPRVNRESDSEYEDAHEDVSHTADGTLTFGAAALALHRERKTVGMEAFRSPPTGILSSVPSPRFTPRSPCTPPPLSSTYHSGSRLTPVKAARHPLSLSALHNALQSALASKRFACSHLLALRFTDEEDDGYWEDVRSVMGLLTTTFVDASSRLLEAIHEVEQQKLRDQNPTPSSLKDSIHDSDLSMESSVGLPSPLSNRRNMSISFAPLPSHLSKFAAHVDAIQSALDDARENLQQCVTALRECEETRAPNSAILRRRLRQRTRPTSTSSSADEPPAPLPLISPAIEAYERLRRELGLALRECERGRERLLDVVYPPDMYGPEDEDSSDDVPALGHDGSDESDKPDPAFPFDIEQESPPMGCAVVALEAVDGGAMDDATSHLLLSTSTQHLPPPGIEQVFEADTGSVGVFKRERSKLTREERIKLMKAKRENGGGILGLGLSTTREDMVRGGGVEKWGPGGEVVQELKDVIWKVGERRRQMADADPSKSLDATTPRSNEPAQLDEALT